MAGAKFYRYDNPREIAEVLMLQWIFTVFEKIRQNPDEITKAIPSRAKTYGKPPNKRDAKN